MIPASPLFTDEELQKVKVLTDRLAAGLRSARQRGCLTGNPLEDRIRSCFDDKRDELLTRPLYLQMLFVIGSESLEEIQSFVDTYLNQLQEEENVKP